MKFIEVTFITDGKNKTGVINPEHIVYMVRMANSTLVETVNGKNYRILEKPSDVQKLISSKEVDTAEKPPKATKRKRTETAK